MKYGILFGIIAISMAFAAITHRGWYLLCVWPAFSFAMISSGYLYFGPSVYGKSKSGVLSRIRTLFLLPYLLYLWAVWYIVRSLIREPAYNQLNERIYIGRRLMGHEFPKHFDHVIDLTCEFSEPKPLRSTDYYSYQILDGFVPSTKHLQLWIDETATLTGNIYIHCGEGHGRTGLFAAALLLKLEQFTSADDALEFVKSKRPLVQLGKRQLATLAEFEVS